MQNKQELKELVKNFLQGVSDEFFVLPTGTLCSLETGEHFSKAEYDKYVKRRLNDYQVELFVTVNETVRQETNLESDQRIINKNSKKPNSKLKTKEHFEGGKEFNIVYRNRLEEINSMKLTTNEKLVYYILREFAQYPTNCIVIKDHIPSIKELEPIIGLTDRSIGDALISLEKKNLIKRKQYGHKKAIYINPEYYATGKDLDIGTLQMFNLIECDDAKVDEYIKYSKENKN